METIIRTKIDDDTVEFTNLQFQDIVREYGEYSKSKPKPTHKQRDTFLRGIFAQYIVA